MHYTCKFGTRGFLHCSIEDKKCYGRLPIDTILPGNIYIYIYYSIYGDIVSMIYGNIVSIYGYIVSMVYLTSHTLVRRLVQKKMPGAACRPA